MNNIKIKERGEEKKNKKKKKNKYKELWFYFIG